MENTKCNYCRTNKNGICDVVNFENPVNSSENYDIQFVFGEIDISKKFGDDVVATFALPIQYCPFCGRKLVSEEGILL